MHKSRQRSSMRIGIASLALLLAVATFQSGAVAATARPTTAAYDEDVEVENFIYWVYVNLLDRAPDQVGLTYWTDVVEQYGPGPFVFAVVESQEWRRARVEQYYARWLDRYPDDEGLAYWTTYLAGHNFASFESFLGGSDEAYDHSGGTDTGFIHHVYGVAAEREPTEEDLVDGHEALLTGRRSDYVSTVLLQGDGLIRRVTLAYGVTLRRNPDPDGEAYWIGYYHNTGNFAAMLANMLLSPEAWEMAQAFPPR